VTHVLCLVITLASVRLALSKEEETDIQSGACLAMHEDCSPSVLISSGLELEEQQCVFLNPCM
jgi:hypothetical protein